MSDDPVPAALRDRYDRVERGERLHAVAPNEVHRLRVDGRPAVLKRSTGPRGDAGVEGRVQRLVARETSLSVPAVLWVGDGAFLAAFDDDVPDPASATATEAWCRAAGRGLATLHSLSFDRHGPLRVDGDPADPAAGLRVDAPPGATWADGVDRLLATFRSSVAGTDYAAVVEDVRSFVADHADRVAGPDPVLLHGWFTPEHVGVRDGRVRAVVDFEHAVAGAAAYDCWRLALPTFGPEGAAEDGAPEWRAFREAYATVRPLPEDLFADEPFYRLLVGVSYLDSLATQRGIEGNRDRADALVSTLRDRLADLRAAWA